MDIKRFYSSLRRFVQIEVLILLLTTSLFAQAEISSEQAIADCLKVNEFSAKGEKYYKLKQYAKAREQYEQQVGWSESCQLGEQKIATAYNNVALTYLHEGDYLKARAWLSIFPGDKKSIFNLGKIDGNIKNSLEKLSGKSEGQYWQYAGKSLWSVITIKPQGQKYKFDFQGYYAGLMAMYYGPNMGEFSTVLEVNNGKAHYSMIEKDEDYLDCVYDFDIKKDMLAVERTAGSSCGFGHNVSAEGVYYRVEP
jgi:tetratricopeptide (TPR) repeat protein